MPAVKRLGTSKFLGVKLPLDLVREVEDAAFERKLSLSEFVRRAINCELGRQHSKGGCMQCAHAIEGPRKSAVAQLRLEPAVVVSAEDDALDL